jgi:hypothetical protein
MNQLPEKLYLGKNLKQYVMKEAVIYKIRGYTCRSTLTQYPDSEATSLCSFSLILRALH